MRAARIYTTNQYAASAMGITLRHFSQLCRKYGVETPCQRKRRFKAT